MDYEIIWTDRAFRSFEEICDYLFNFFGEKELEKFINRANSLIETIALDPRIFKKLEGREHVHHGFLHQNTTLFYKVNENEKRVYLLLFWDNRQNPFRLGLEIN